MPESHPDDFRMSLGDHLEDLRRRIIYALLGVLGGVVAMLFVGDHLMAIICQPVLYELERRGMDPTLHTPAPISMFSVWLTVVLISGVTVSIPWVVLQFWRFIAPGLYRHERRFVVLLVPGSAVLATLGVLFMYYIMLPITIWFLVGFHDRFNLPDLHPTVIQQQLEVGGGEAGGPGPGALPAPGGLPMLEADPPAPAEGAAWVNTTTHTLRVVIGGRVYGTTLKPTGQIATPMFMIDQYVRFVMWLGLAFVLAFQLPLVMLLLGATRLVSRQQFARGRKWAVLVCVVVGAILTPPDPMSQVALALPLFVLYEFGLLLMRWFIRPAAMEYRDA